jgi:hypothetical protein
MNRGTWGTFNAVMLTGLIILALTVWMPAKLGATAKPVPSPTVPGWEPITLGYAVLFAEYSDREDWSGCQTKGISPLYVRCPDGYTLEIR